MVGNIRLIRAQQIRKICGDIDGMVCRIKPPKPLRRGALCFSPLPPLRGKMSDGRGPRIGWRGLFGAPSPPALSREHPQHPQNPTTKKTKKEFWRERRERKAFTLSAAEGNAKTSSFLRIQKSNVLKRRYFKAGARVLTGGWAMATGQQNFCCCSLWMLPYRRLPNHRESKSLGVLNWHQFQCDLVVQGDSHLACSPFPLF